MTPSFTQKGKARESQLYNIGTLIMIRRMPSLRKSKLLVRRPPFLSAIPVFVFLIIILIHNILKWTKNFDADRLAETVVEKVDQRDEIILDLFRQVATLQRQKHDLHTKYVNQNHIHNADSTRFMSVGQANGFQNSGLSYRKFVSYTSSKWEQLWLDHVDDWARNRSICNILLNQQAELVHDFLLLTCTSFIDDEWCKVEDGFQSLWYNTKNRSSFHITFARPAELKGKKDPPSRPVIPGKEHEHIVSKFIFRDEINNRTYTEYIEPLVSHLRHPLAKCLNASRPPLWLALVGSYIIPVPRKPPGTGNTLFVDIGSASWNDIGYGPAVSFVTDVWKRHGIDFERIQAYETNVSPQNYYAQVPSIFQNRTIFRQCPFAVTSDEESIHKPFIPNEITRVSNPNDYVLLRLDVDPQKVENGIIQHILRTDFHVDELLWEHHGEFIKS